MGVVGGGVKCPCHFFLVLVRWYFKEKAWKPLDVRGRLKFGEKLKIIIGGGAATICLILKKFVCFRSAAPSTTIIFDFSPNFNRPRTSSGFQAFSLKYQCTRIRKKWQGHFTPHQSSLRPILVEAKFWSCALCNVAFGQRSPPVWNISSLYSIQQISITTILVGNLLYCLP